MGPPKVVWVLLFAAVAGCTGGSEAAPPQGSEPIDPDAGAVRASVYDEEFVPLGEVTITLQPTLRTATTDANGAATFENVSPGQYEAFAYRVGYQALARSVEVLTGETTEVVFTLAVLPVNGTYYETFPFVGLQSCQWYVEGTIATCTYPYTNAHGTAKQNGVNLTQYGLPPDLQANKDRYNFTLRLDHEGVVSELFWKPGSLGAQIQALVIACAWYDPFWDECIPPGSPAGTVGVRYFFERGTSPVRIVWKHPAPEHLILSPWVMSRANVNGDDTHLVGIAIDQKIEMYNTVFYGAAPPEAFTVGPGDG